MAKANSNLTWKEIDPASLPTSVKERYDTYKDTYKAMKLAREFFEEALNETVAPPSGKRVVCGYNFGKLSIALADDDRKPTKAVGSLADFLAAAEANGRRT